MKNVLILTQDAFADNYKGRAVWSAPAVHVSGDEYTVIWEEPERDDWDEIEIGDVIDWSKPDMVIDAHYNDLSGDFTIWTEVYIYAEYPKGEQSCDCDFRMFDSLTKARAYAEQREAHLTESERARTGAHIGRGRYDAYSGCWEVDEQERGYKIYR